MDKKEYNRLYRLKHRDKLLNDSKKYYFKNKEKLSEYQKIYRKENREKLLAQTRIRSKIWYQKNKERRKERIREYDKKRADLRHELDKTAKGKYKYIRQRHPKKWNGDVITFEEFIEETKKPCGYCGDEAKMGLDRVDNSKGYTKDNVMSCCKVCNFMKKAMTQDDFFKHIKNIYENRIGITN